MLQATVLSAFTLASASYASVLTNPEPPKNVLAVKSPLDKDGKPQNDQSQIVALKVDVKRDAQNKIDTQQLVKDAKDQVDQAQGQQIQANQYDVTQLPAKVKQKFDQAGQNGRGEMLNWSYYSWDPYYGWGYYGYSNYPYFYYDPITYYYPSYGLYYSDYLYDYSYAYSYWDGGYYLTFYVY
jgi:hypothetical protein